MGGNFKFQVHDSFLEYFWGEIGRFEKRISLSEKKTFKYDLGPILNEDNNKLLQFLLKCK